MKGAWLRWHAGYESDGIARVSACCAVRGGSRAEAVVGSSLRRTTDIMAAASVANENFAGRFNAASKVDRLAELALRGWLKKTGGQRSRIAVTAPRRVVAANRYSAMVTNRVLPPKWISVILLPSLTNAEYFALLVSSFHCTGASATTFPFIEIRTWVSSADTA